MPKIDKAPQPQTTLDKIEAMIADLWQEIEVRKAEIKRLEDAAAVIRSVEGIDSGKPFAGKTIVECAMILLREKSPQFVKDLAKEAIARGYVSQKGGDQDAITKSFATAMVNAGLTFRRIAPARFELSDLGKQELEIIGGGSSD